MSDVGLERNSSFLTEIWTLYAIGMTILVARLVVRLVTVGIRGLRGDDLFAFLVMIMYTCDAATVHLVSPKDMLGSNVEAAAFQTTHTLSQADIDQFTIGSKLQLTAWYSYTALLWCLKGTMLCFFQRITTGLWQSRLVKYLMYACAVSYVAVFLTLTFGCFPTYRNWQVVPDPGLKCTFRMQNFVVTVVLNVLTDAAILCIPLPLLWQLQVPLKKKLVVGLLICSGFFVIAAAIIRVVLTLGANPSGTNINRWGVRETIVGIVAVNIPILRPIFRKSFWTTGQINSSSQGKTASDGRTRTTTYPSGLGPYEMASSLNESKHSRKNRDSFGGSEEFIIDKPDKNIKPKGNDVVVQTTYHVRSEENVNDSRDAWGAPGSSAKATAYRGHNAV
ncbi:putative G-protein coupled receptors family 1 profile domain-containing protein [Seiridium unicorne]|uniref:G-protein coupled receptors family 1 profile domain-containing protein n=1 Tax=Seiridium unicorne TaxID=138068 RepID=A0ABR2UFF7_9PEZI